MLLARVPLFSTGTKYLKIINNLLFSYVQQPRGNEAEGAWLGTFYFSLRPLSVNFTLRIPTVGTKDGR